MKALLALRTHDNFGSGEYGASRGTRTHNGEDFACLVGAGIFPVTAGKVTKIGYPYGDDKTFRYVQVTLDDHDYRYFYIDPIVRVGDVVGTNTIIGFVQDLDKRYKGITPHCHFEVKVNGKHIDPRGFNERT